MSAISPVSTAATQTAIAASASTLSAPEGSSSQTNGGSADQPAVIVSLSNAAGGAQNAVFAQPLSDQVAGVLNLVSGANAFSNILAHYDYAAEAAKFGVAIANRNYGGSEGAVADLSNAAITAAAGLGIQVKDSVSPDAVAKGAAPGTLSISAFSFASDGNNYAVTPGANGSFVETENGQTLYNFQGRTPDALSTGSVADAGALQAVVTLNADAAKSSVNSDASKLSVLA
jgi:hypothetical protein